MPECSVFELAQHVAHGQRDGDLPPRFALFLGAGASIGSNIDGSEKMMEMFRDQLRIRWQREGAETGFEDWLLSRDTWQQGTSEYSRLFETFAPTARARSRHIERLVRFGRPSYGYLFLTQLLAQGYLDTVITTNFDDLVYEACARWHSVRPRVYAYGAPAGSIRHERGRPAIVKLHGDFLYSHLTKNTAHEMTLSDPNMERQVRDLLQRYELIVIGYSGNDESIVDLLKEVPEDHDGGIYWCVYRDQPPSERVTNLLKRKNWFRVKTDGFEAVMGELLHTVKFTLPDLESAVWEQTADTFRVIMESGSPYRKHFLGAAATTAKGECSAADRSTERWVRAFLKGMGEYERGRAKDAIDSLRQAQELAPDDVSTLAFLGFVLTRTGEVMEAVEMLQEAYGHGAENADLISTLGFALTQAGRVDDALVVLRKGHERHAGNPLLVSSLSWALMQAGKVPEALATLRSAQELHPDHAALLGSLGFALTQDGNLPDALDILRRAQRLWPDDPDVLSSLGFALIENKDVVNALEVLQHAIDCRPDDPQILHDLAVAFYCNNREAEGLQTFALLNEVTSGCTSDDLGMLKWRALGLRGLRRLAEALEVFTDLVRRLPVSMVHLRDATVSLRRLVEMEAAGSRECLSLIEEALVRPGEGGSHRA